MKHSGLTNKVIFIADTSALKLQKNQLVETRCGFDWWHTAKVAVLDRKSIKNYSTRLNFVKQQLVEFIF